MIRECRRHKRKSFVAIIIAAALLVVCQSGFAQDAHSQEREETQWAKLSEKSEAATKNVAASSMYREKSNEASSEVSGGKRTELADGMYECDAFGWSGGSGRLKYITCQEVTVEKGQAYAEIEFSSDKYDSVKTGGKKYGMDAGASSGGSVFNIPVKINENTRISARTTAMSQPHWIDYDIYVFIKDADKSGQLSKETVVSHDSLKGDAPAILGLPEAEPVDTGDASLMRIYSFGEISLLQIDISSNRSVLKYDMPGDNIYESNVVNYLILPQDAEIPAGTDKGFIIVRTPVSSWYTAEDIRKLDYKDIVQSEADIVKLPADQIKKFLWFGKGKKEAAEELEKSLVTLGLPLFFDRADAEKGNESKAQWEKVYELFQ